ncbi:hypothetical protein L6164_023681 [Bauhinia variegata]|uniref:Uncharacterized protein n=1 Tax=Bauhinia variegata TaxID=167791 RepID=A0ACB9MIY6_BAUVA|nr:hypothetical protein L6164_023681 [Bauhinia variegata]
MRNLQRLKIFYTSELPRSPQSFPSNLTKITLKQIEFLHYDTTPTLENLPKLQILKLVGSEGSRDRKKFGFNCSANGFPNLEVLQMPQLHIAEWKLGEDAMQKFRNLMIKDCIYLTVLPNQLWNFSELRRIHVLWPSAALAESLVDVNYEMLVVHPPLPSASSSSRDW